MQTIYYTTPNFIRHTGNVVDLAEYRRKLSLVQSREEPEESPVKIIGADRVCPTQEETSSRRDRHQRRAWLLDICASLGIVVMTLTFTIHVLML